MIPYQPPQFQGDAFNCPHCGAYASQAWSDVSRSGGWIIDDLDVAVCSRCSRYSLWREENMIYPSSGTAPLPNPDLPDDIRSDYEEARDIASRSPRGAAALLRLAIQKLCVQLGEKGDSLNADIGSLVQRGLNPKVQKALDVVRVVGNNAVHPGQIDLRDDTLTVGQLFDLVNLITEAMISQPKHVEGMYEKLPAEQREAIEKRDSTT